MSNEKLRNLLLAIQGTCQEVAHEVEDPIYAVNEIEGLIRKALAAQKPEPLYTAQEVRERARASAARYFRAAPDLEAEVVEFINHAFSDSEEGNGG